MSELQAAPCRINQLQAQRGRGTYPMVSNLASIPDSEISRNPSETGSENRLAPALPGLKKSTPFTHSIAG